jgi:hypothetical protein
MKLCAITTADGTFEALSLLMLGGLSDKAVYINSGFSDLFLQILKANPNLEIYLNVDKGMNIDLEPFNSLINQPVDAPQPNPASLNDNPGTNLTDDTDDEEDQESGNETESDNDEKSDEEDPEFSDNFLMAMPENPTTQREEMIDQITNEARFRVMEPVKAKLLSKEAIKSGRQIAEERITIEQAFGRLKNSYKLLQQTIPIQLIDDMIYYIISACYFCNSYYRGLNHVVSKDD